MTALADPQALRDHAASLAPLLRAGDLLVLAGPLGAGKTVFTQGLAAGLGVTGPVTSPTFVIARVHPAGRADGLALVHVDAYRLGLADDADPLAALDDLDLDSDLADAVVVVEWGEGLVERLSEDRLVVRIDRHPDHDVRTVTLEPTGARWDGVDLP